MRNYIDSIVICKKTSVEHLRFEQRWDKPFGGGSVNTIGEIITQETKMNNSKILIIWSGYSIAFLTKPGNTFGDIEPEL